MLLHPRFTGFMKNYCNKMYTIIFHRQSMNLFLLCIFIFAGSAQAAKAHVDHPTWELVDKEDGIEIFHREIIGSPIVALKGRGVIKAPLWKVASILLDTKRAPEWVDSLGESKVVRRLNTYNYIEYNHIRTPFIMKDREFISNVTIKVDSKSKKFALQYSPINELISTPKSSKIRGQIVSGSFDLKSLTSDSTILVAEIHCDPMGSVPKWIVNFFQRSWPHDTFQSLRRQVKKTDINIPPAFSDVLKQTLNF